MNKKDLILVGGGGHCKSCIDVIEQEGGFSIKGIVDRQELVGQEVSGYKIIASDHDINDLAKDYKNFLITLGQLKSAGLRLKLYNKIKEAGANLPIIISPKAYVSKSANIGEGTIVLHYALINAMAKIGHNCIINTKALIEHDTIIGNHNHISTASVLNGAVKVGDFCTIGSNATVIHNKNITNHVVIGAGAVVTKDIMESGIYVGVPAKKI